MTPVEELFQLLWDTPKDKLTWFAIKNRMLDKEKELFKQSFHNGFTWCCERELTDEILEDYKETLTK